MITIILIIGLAFCFYLLAKVCDEYFVKSLDIIAKKLKLSEDVAGATFMAIGSSAPEFFTSLLALTKVGSEDVGAGTIVGSAIFNILVIVGGSAVVATAYLKWKPVLRDMGFYVMAILALFYTFMDGVITLTEAGAYIIAYFVYILVLARWSKWFPDAPVQDQMNDISEEVEKQDEKLERRWGILGKFLSMIDDIVAKTFPDLEKNPKKYVSVFTISIIYIIAISWVLVEMSIGLAHQLGIPEVIIALTILAGGTSIPDLLSSLIVAKQGRGDMAVSNAVGSNSFDILICLGLPWLIYILYTGKNVVVATENLTSSVLLLFFTVVAILFLLIIQKFKIGRKSGLLLIGIYIAYLVYAIYMAYNPS